MCQSMRGIGDGAGIGAFPTNQIRTSSIPAPPHRGDPSWIKRRRKVRSQGVPERTPQVESGEFRKPYDTETRGMIGNRYPEPESEPESESEPG